MGLLQVPNSQQELSCQGKEKDGFVKHVLLNGVLEKHCPCRRGILVLPFSKYIIIFVLYIPPLLLFQYCRR